MSSFAVGLLFGQMSVLLVLGIVIRFFLFADGHNLKSHITRKPEVHVTPAESASTDSLLEQTYYDVGTHAPESMDWFTVLIALVVRAMREQAAAGDQLLLMLNEIVNSEKIPTFVGGIKITELHLGSDYPLLSNCKVVQVGENLEIQFDIDLKDQITLGIDTQLLLSYPKPMLASLPVSGKVSLVNFSGRIRLSLATEENDTFITISIDPTYSMEFKVESLIGSRAQLQNVPKIGQLIESGLRKVVADRCVAPKFQKIRLPKAQSRTKANTNASGETASTGADGNTPANPNTAAAAANTTTTGATIPTTAANSSSAANASSNISGVGAGASFTSGADRSYYGTPQQRGNRESVVN